LSLSLMDDGGSHPLEGAWREDGGRAELGVIDRIERSDAGVTLGWALGRLTLRPDAQGWIGELTLDGRAVPVTISR